MVPDPDLRAEVPVSGHQVGELTQGFSEQGLWVRMATLALRDLSRQTSVPLEDLAKVPTLVGISSGYHWEQSRKSPRHGEVDDQAVPWSELEQWYRQGIFAKIYRQCEVPVPPIHELYFGDEAGVAQLLARASSLLGTGCDRVLLGAIDSTADIPMARALARLGLLKTIQSSVGQMPGEIASFVLLGRAERHGQASGLGVVMGLGVAQEFDARCAGGRTRGVGYASSIMRSVEATGIVPERFYLDLNGESRRAYDWGSALLRLPAELRELPSTLPIASFGSIRAGYGLTSMIHCSFMFERSAGARVPTMIVCGSDDGQRASVLMTTN